MKIKSVPISPSPYEIRTPHVEIFTYGLGFYRDDKMYITHQLIKNIKRKQ